ncbi:hypothetical protein [Macrococcus carouselicus]|uniref:DUF2178 domain-containing protein n=1 Tax=Macrococcus carouselicus TaxID=69969 RepID=A0A9Q8CFY7_9STAP|nr:hypothetical protein [Macrococcus carouselicus]TDM00688.1 hypothetical protein ERX40_09100 [Macrococcus carouselicus]
MKRTFNQQVLLGLGIMLTLMGLAIGLIVGMNNLSLWLTMFVLGIVLILRSFIFEGEKFDEREQMINCRSYKFTFMMTLFVSFIFYSLYFFKMVHLAGEDAFIIFMATMILTQGISSFIYAKLL